MNFLKKLFPFISAAASLGGPLGTMAANAVGAAIGADKPIEGSIDGIVAAVKGATPEQLAAMKQAEQEFQLKMKELGFNNAEELERLAVADRDSARKREMTLKDHTPSILAGVVTAGFFGMLALVSLRGVEESARDLCNIMIGTLGTAWVSVIAYYFGSSSGSDRKTEIIANGNGKH